MRRRAAWLVLPACAALACDPLYGIHELPAGSDAAAVTDAGAPGADADAGLPACSPDAGAVTAAQLEWALWPMPNSPADVQAGAPHPESYTDDGDGTVTDDVTGLVWQQNATHTDVQSADVTYCKSLTLAGHDDWTLPTYLELVSIVDLSQQSPAIDPVHFPNADADIYWSSTAATATTSEGWDVSFINGQTGRDTTTGIHHARCVRRPGRTIEADDGGSPCRRYVVTRSGDTGIVKDTLTGLTWQYAPSHQNDTGAGSRDYCANLTFGGLSGWRLPTASEVLSLVDVTQPSPALDPTAFSTQYDQSFWSSSPVAGSTTSGWSMNLGPGTRSEYRLTGGAGVRCVR